MLCCCVMGDAWLRLPRSTWMAPRGAQPEEGRAAVTVVTERKPRARCLIVA